MPLVGHIYVLDFDRILVFPLIPSDSTPWGSIPVDPGSFGLAGDASGLAVGGTDDNGAKVTFYNNFGVGGVSPLRTLQGPSTLLSNPIPLFYVTQEEDLLFVLNSDFTTDSTYVTVYPRSAEPDQAPMWSFDTLAVPLLLTPKPCFSFPSGGPPGGLLCVPDVRERILMFLPDGTGGLLRTIEGPSTGLGGEELKALASTGDSLYAFGTLFDVRDQPDGFNLRVFDANRGGDVPSTCVIPSADQDPLVPAAPLDFGMDVGGNFYVLQYSRNANPTPHPDIQYSLSIYPASTSGPDPQPSFTISGPDAGFGNPVRIAVVSAPDA